MDSKDRSGIFRILDANCNRLREALRVVEEYFRFVVEDSETSMILKTARHGLQEILTALGENELVAARETESDPFAVEVSAVELERSDLASAVCANLRRAQEAARVIEEYAKLIPCGAAVEKAKLIRFTVYDAEKKFREKTA